MLTYSDWLKNYKQFTGVSDTLAKGPGTSWMNYGRQLVLKGMASYITEDTFTANTVAGQQDYMLPARTNKVADVTVTFGSVKYSPQQITSPEVWARITIVNTPTSTVPLFYYVDRYRISIFPTPSASGGVGGNVSFIRALVTTTEPDLNQEDIVVGTISATNGSNTVTGEAVNWTSNQIGWSILMPNSQWYSVQDVPDQSTILLDRLYEGPSTSGASYRLGQTSIIPEEGQLLPVFYAAMVYYMSIEKELRAAQYSKMYFGDPRLGDGLNGLIKQYGSRTQTRLTPGSDIYNYPLNPNLYPQNIPYAP